MSGEAGNFDRELGQLIQLHRIAQGVPVEDLARELGLPPAQIEKYEAGSIRLSVYRYWTIISALRKEPSLVLEQLRERLSFPDDRPVHVERSGTEFMASNRGRKVVSALAMCDEPETLDALADLILAIGVHTQAKGRLSGMRNDTSVARHRNLTDF